MALIGAGWIGGIHLDALDRLGRSELVGVVSPSLDRATAAAASRGARGFTELERMLDDARPGRRLGRRAAGPLRGHLPRPRRARHPVPRRKPLAAVDASGPERVAAAIAGRDLVAAVGYHLRALEGLPEARERIGANPPHLVVGRWHDGTPPRAWWWREALGGEQVIEQATHLFDMARLLAGEAIVVGAASTRSDPALPEGADVADATAAVLQFASGAVGSFSTTRRLGSWVIEVAFASEGLLTTIGRPDEGPGDWTIAFTDANGTRTIAPGRDPYERQAEAFLDAVEAGDPRAVLATYEDALLTDRLTRAVVAATGRPG